VGANQFSPESARWKTLRDHEIPLNQRQRSRLAQASGSAKRIKPWWFQSETGKVCVAAVKYSSWTIELAKGKPSVEVASGYELVKALTSIKAAVEAGELDAQIETASASLRSGFRK
jgi:hypothetical protein